jgi:fluoroacetyl-CoA thioesterase
VISSALQPGFKFTHEIKVEDRMTVPGLYLETPFCADMPAVLATGYMVGLMELACTNGIMEFVDWPRVQSLGTMVNFRHLAATPPGMRLRIEGEVTRIEGRTIGFAVRAWDEHDLICEGEHERVLVESARFNQKLTDKKARAGL